MCHSLKEMTPLLSAEQFFERVKPGEPFIPQDENGEPDTARVGIALPGAVVNPFRGFTSRVIVARLPWLLDKVGSRAFRGNRPSGKPAVRGRAGGGLRGHCG